MSALLWPVVIDPCQTNLRGRRRSSVHPLNAIPRLFTTATLPTDDVEAACDGPTVVDLPETEFSGFNVIQTLPLTNPCLPSNAHLPDLATKFTIPRHSDGATSPVDVYTPTTPSPIISSSDHAAFTSEPFLEKLYTPQETERSRRRLAAGFFTYFLCGWGDGGTSYHFFLCR
jgi:hypothetical protein